MVADRKQLEMVISLIEAEKLIDAQLKKGQKFVKTTIKNNNEMINVMTQLNSWDKENVQLLTEIFKNQFISEQYQSINLKKVSLSIISGPKQFDRNKENFQFNVKTKLKFLENLIRNIKGIKIFVVHGHDESSKISVARFLEKIDLKPIILHEQPNKGRTIIEKFEQYSEVDFAIVLLSPDDIGYPKGKEEEAKSRARQNVIFELGFFIGKLGRNKVCALYKEGVEIPSDYSGVLYKRFDGHGGWQLELAREIDGAGIKLDFNKLR
jgi:predicted nucleotide-binding protein